MPLFYSTSPDVLLHTIQVLNCMLLNVILEVIVNLIIELHAEFISPFVFRCC